MSTSCIIFRTSNQYADVAVACREALWILWIEFLLENKYLMHRDRRCQDGLKYSSDVTEQPNVKTRRMPSSKVICFLLFVTTFQLVLVLGELGSQTFQIHIKAPLVKIITLKEKSEKDWNTIQYTGFILAGREPGPRALPYLIFD